MFNSFKSGHIFCRFLALTLALAIGPHTTALADDFDQKWLEPRKYYINLVDAGCAGDKDALNKLMDHATRLGSERREEKSVAAHMVSWALHPGNSCPPWKEFQSHSEWRYWIKEAVKGGHPQSLYSYGKSLVEGLHGVSVDKQRGLEHLRLAEIRGAHLAAWTLGRYYTKSDHGFVPDRSSAQYYYRRAERLGASGEKFAQAKSIAENMRKTGFTPDIILQLMQGKWAVQEFRKPSDEVPFYFYVQQNTIYRNVTRYDYAGEAQSFDISIDYPKCINADKSARLWYEDTCYEVAISSPNKVTLFPISLETDIFSTERNPSLTLKRVY